MTGYGKMDGIKKTACYVMFGNVFLGWFGRYIVDGNSEGSRASCLLIRYRVVYI